MACKALLHNQAQDFLRKHNRAREKGDTASGVRLSAVSYSLFSLWFCSWLSEPVKAPASWLRAQQWSPENHHKCWYKPYSRTQSHDAWKPPHKENVPSECFFFNRTCRAYWRNWIICASLLKRVRMLLPGPAKISEILLSYICTFWE